MSSAKCLVGFSTALDWRPLEFVQLDTIRACSLCNVVPKETFLLECSHVLCDVCYRVLLQGRQRCPLDGEEFRENDIQKISFKTRQVAMVRVRCCNAISGCDFTGTLEEMESHFFNECTYHAVTCNGCNANVLRRDIANHFSEQGCQVRDSSSEAIPAGDRVYEMGRKIDTSLETITGMVSSIEDKLNAHVVAIDNAKDSIERVKECVTTNGNEVRFIKERMDNEECLLRAVAHSACREAYFQVRNISRILEDRTQCFYTVFPASDVSNVCGYSTELQLCLLNDTANLLSRVYFKATSEESRLEWLSSIDVAVVLIHPYYSSKNIERALYQIVPGGPRWQWVSGSSPYIMTSFKLDDIRKGGFIRGDSICLGIKIL